MPVENWSETVSVVRLADDPQFTDDLECLEGKLEAGPVDVVLDLRAVHFINSSNIAKLLKIRKVMVSSDRRLVLCSTNTRVWSAFLITGLDKVFEFSDDVTTALATLQMA